MQNFQEKKFRIQFKNNGQKHHLIEINDFIQTYIKKFHYLGFQWTFIYKNLRIFGPNEKEIRNKSFLLNIWEKTGCKSYKIVKISYSRPNRGSTYTRLYPIYRNYTFPVLVKTYLPNTCITLCILTLLLPSAKKSRAYYNFCKYWLSIAYMNLCHSPHAQQMHSGHVVNRR